MRYLTFLFISLFFSNISLDAAPRIRPIPWVTEGAVEFLDDYFSTHDNPKVLEFGCGASTLWFAQRTDKLTSVEHHRNWFNRINKLIINTPSYSDVEFYILKPPYYDVCDEFEDESFDLILVDGRNRKGCLSKALAKLKPGGVLMLDNSERHYYHEVFYLMDGWESDKYIQTTPDSCNFMYPGWETRWWIKPFN